MRAPAPLRLCQWRAAKLFLPLVRFSWYAPPAPPLIPPLGIVPLAGTLRVIGLSMALRHAAFALSRLNARTHVRPVVSSKVISGHTTEVTQPPAVHV